MSENVNDVRCVTRHDTVQDIDFCSAK